MSQTDKFLDTTFELVLTRQDKFYKNMFHAFRTLIKN